MKTRIFQAEAFLALLLFGILESVTASPLYDYAFIAQTGQNAGATGYKFKSFKSDLSINDNGKVAFIAILDNSGTTVGEGVFVGDGSLSGAENVSTSDPPATTKTFGSIWINNADKIAAQYRITMAPNPAGVKRYWKSGNSWMADLIAKATTARQAITIDPCLPQDSCPQTVIQRVEAFDAIWDQVSMNDSDVVAYTGQVNLDSGTRYYNLTAQSQYRHTSDAFALTPYHTIGFIPNFSPVIANNGEILATTGTSDADPIWLYSTDLTTHQTIADSAGFSRIGHNPGISTDGAFIAFYGQESVPAGQPAKLPAVYLRATIEGSPVLQALTQPADMFGRW